MGVVGGLGASASSAVRSTSAASTVSIRLTSGRRFLGDTAQARCRGQRDGAGVGVQLASDQFEQGRFARAVTTDQRDAMALGNGHGGAVEQHAPAEAEGQFIDVQHAEGW